MALYTSSLSGFSLNLVTVRLFFALPFLSFLLLLFFILITWLNILVGKNSKILFQTRNSWEISMKFLKKYETCLWHAIVE